MVELLLTGYLGIMLALFLTGCGLPIPEEIPIVAAGVLSRTGTLYWPIALPCTIIAAVAGDSAIYWIGYQFGRAVLRDHPWWVGFLTPEREKKAEHMIRHHGLRLLFVVRFLPGLRMPIYLTTGILKMPFRRFLLIDGLCASVVVGTFFGLSYWFGEEIKGWIESVQSILKYIVLGILAVIAVSWYYKRHRRMAEIRAVELTEKNDASLESPTSDGITAADASDPPTSSPNAAETIRETHPAG